MIYKVETIKDGTEKYFFFRNLETMSIEELPSKYLMHKIKCKRSPNTVKRTAFSICYYMKYMAEKEMELTEVYQLDYENRQNTLWNFYTGLKPETIQSKRLEKRSVRMKEPATHT